MTTRNAFSPSGRLAVVLGFCLLAWAGAANAETSRQGFYAGLELGFANAADLSSTLSGVNHPTQCDQVLKDVDPTNVVPLSHNDCHVDDTPETLSDNAFDLGTGFLGGFSAGYALNGFRFEFEYMYRSHGGHTSPWALPGSNEALSSKNNEVSVLDPPSERISDFNAHQFFLNAYYDLLNATRWTPYLGAGVGFARTSLDYSNRFSRRTLAQGYPSGKPPAAAGTLSFWDDQISDTSFGFQLLAGLDYELTEKVSIGMKGRWASFNDISHNGVWDLVRSHRPVRADGETPFTSSLAFDDIQYWGLTFGMKYYF